ncbi:hypothetical protein [Hymenobacter psoromatis]|uniref:hypothetical protein n=1 Tax=Hymenobacter psoromatis TaxID=1484116 RepID=UPI001CBBDE67|nr:hypothetical protein [Hymenobacter psoromatis]
MPYCSVGCQKLVVGCLAVGLALAARPGLAQVSLLRPGAVRPDSAAARPTPPTVLPSQLVVRLSYSPQTLFAGRDYGLRQSTTTPSLNYYHRSGAYVGVSGSLYSVSTPHYLLTDLTAGYGNLLGNNLLYNFSYDHYVFSEAGQGTLTNAGSVLLSYDVGPISLGTTYSLLFGNGQTGHRLLPSISGYKAWKNLGFIDKLFILPSLSATIGTDNIVYQVFPRKAVSKVTKAKKPAKAGQPVDMELTSFGLMSWNLALPVKVRIGNFTAGATYNYIIPIQLAHESADAGFSNKSFISLTASYAF